MYKVTTRKAAPRTDYMAMLDKRLKRMEERVIKIIPRQDFENNPALPRAVVKPAQPRSGLKRNAGEAFGLHRNGMADDKDDEAARQIAKQLCVPKLDDNDDDSLLSLGADALPSKELQQHLAELYFDTLHGQTYFMLHKPTFMRRLSMDKLPPVLTLAICSLSARFSTHHELQDHKPSFLRGEKWARAAQDIALKRYDSPNITILIVFILLCLQGFGRCQGGRSWMMCGMALRMAYSLRLHKDPEYDGLAQTVDKGRKLSFVDREIRRRTMWCCFTLDRYTASGTERPITSPEHCMLLQLPVKEQMFVDEIPAQTEKLNDHLDEQAPKDSHDDAKAKKLRSNMGAGAYLMRLIALWGRLVAFMNHGGRMRDDYAMWSPNSSWRKLNEQVKDFKTNLPECLQYSRENLDSHAAEHTANQFLLLHIAYHQVVLFLNRFAFAATAMYTPCKGEPSSFVENGKTDAIGAAASISKLMEEATIHKVVAPFAGYAAYMSSAVHIHCIFSRQNPELQNVSKAHLKSNKDYLRNMRNYWGTFHHLLENLQQLHRQHADATTKGAETQDPNFNSQRVFQFGDWHERFPRGVSQTNYEPLDGADPDGVGLGRGSNDLQSVEDYFATSARNATPTSKSKQRKKSTGGRSQNTQTKPTPAKNAQKQTNARKNNVQADVAPTTHTTNADTSRDDSRRPSALLQPPNPLPFSQDAMMNQYSSGNVLQNYPQFDPNLQPFLPQTGFQPGFQMLPPEGHVWTPGHHTYPDTYIQGHPANGPFIPYNFEAPGCEYPPSDEMIATSPVYPNNPNSFPFQNGIGNANNGGMGM